MNSIIKSYNPSANIYQWTFPVDKDLSILTERKILNFDSEIVFFGRITKDKGIEDLLNAIPIIRASIPFLRVRIIGNSSKEYRDFLLSEIARLKIADSVTFVGLLKTRKELLTTVQKSRLSVLPTYYDNAPKTIIESIALGVPTITYDDGMIPGINDENEILTIIPKGNIASLAESIIILLKDEKKHETLKQHGLNWFKLNYDGNAISIRLMQIFKKVIDLHSVSWFSKPN